MSETTTTPAVVTTGTVKIGRWAYPAIKYGTGRVLRNTKRDGSGELENTNSAAFVADEVQPVVELEDEMEFGEDPADDVNDALVALDPTGRAIMALVGQRYFDFFDDGIVDGSGIWFSHLGWQAAERLGRATVTAALRKLVTAGLWDLGESDEGGGNGPDRWFALTALGAAVANAVSTDVVPPAAEIKATSKHGGKVGAQTAKPGKSTWVIGTPCPKGHTLSDATLYVMPSGRPQCRECRSGFASNA